MCASLLTWILGGHQVAGMHSDGGGIIFCHILSFAVSSSRFDSVCIFQVGLETAEARFDEAALTRIGNALAEDSKRAMQLKPVKSFCFNRMSECMFEPNNWRRYKVGFPCIKCSFRTVCVNLLDLQFTILQAFTKRLIERLPTS